MKAKSALEAKNIKELKLLGSYFDVKNNIEKELGVKLGIRGWESLLERLESLKEKVCSKKHYFLAVCDEKSFVDSKNIISKDMGVKLKSTSIADLKKDIKKLILNLCDDCFDPYEYYEKTKIDKFKNSSKLEGIDIDVFDSLSTLESILEKHKRKA